MIRWKCMWGVGAAALLLWLGPGSGTGHSELFGDYLGWQACQECHPDLTTGWKQTQHARAFESLKKDGKHELPGCVKCHVVAFEQPGGFIDFEMTPELVDVQCEECHGPGSAHAENPDQGDTITAAPDEARCRKCHTPGQDANFNYEKKIKGIHGH